MDTAAALRLRVADPAFISFGLDAGAALSRGAPTGPPSPRGFGPALPPLCPSVDDDTPNGLRIPEEHTFDCNFSRVTGNVAPAIVLIGLENNDRSIRATASIKSPLLIARPSCPANSSPIPRVETALPPRTSATWRITIFCLRTTTMRRSWSVNSPFRLVPAIQVFPLLTCLAPSFPILSCICSAVLVWRTTVTPSLSAIWVSLVLGVCSSLISGRSVSCRVHCGDIACGANLVLLLAKPFDGLLLRFRCRMAPVISFPWSPSDRSGLQRKYTRTSIFSTIALAER